MENIENNKLIAKFMGYDLSRIVNELPVDKNGNYTTENNKFVWIHSLKYDTSWDHLMSVVKRISNIEDGYVNDICFNHTSGYFTISIDTDEESRTFEGFSVTDSWIECCYNAVIEFIKWYNERN